MNIVSWSRDFQEGRVQRDKNVDIINVKPELGFKFDSVFYEPPTRLYRKVVNDITSSLSDEELAKCQMYINTYKF